MKQALGLGPCTHAMQQWVERAKILLRRGNNAFAAIAAAVGFADQRYFTAAFWHEADKTPEKLHIRHS